MKTICARASLNPAFRNGAEAQRGRDVIQCAGTFWPPDIDATAEKGQGTRDEADVREHTYRCCLGIIATLCS